MLILFLIFSHHYVFVDTFLLQSHWLAYTLPELVQYPYPRMHPLMEAEVKKANRSSRQAAFYKEYKRGWAKHEKKFGAKASIGHRPLECIQEEGDLFFLPALWKHQTMNIGEAVGIGGQSIVFGKTTRPALVKKHYEVAPNSADVTANFGLTLHTEASRIYQDLMEMKARAQEILGEKKRADGTMLMPVEMIPIFTQYHEKLQVVANKALKYFRRSLELAPLDIIVHEWLLEVLVMLRKTDEFVTTVREMEKMLDSYDRTAVSRMSLCAFYAALGDQVFSYANVIEDRALYGLAHPLMDKALLVYSKCVPALVHRAETQAHAGKVFEYEDTLRKLEDIDPKMKAFVKKKMEAALAAHSK